jgi:multiple sugar transport system permease protein
MQEGAELRSRQAPTGGDRSASVRGRRMAILWRVALWILLIVLAVIFFLPFLWLLDTALKSQSELSAYPIQFLPSDAQWGDFHDATSLPQMDYSAYAQHSFIVAALATIPTIFISAVVGFAFARLKGRGKNALFALVLATMMIPAFVYVIPTYLMFSHIPGLIGSYYPWLMWGLAGNSMFIFLYRQFFRGIPLELEDAAIVDGCGLFRIFAQIFLPLSKPVIATVAILSFQAQWGDFFTQAIFLNGDNYTLAAQIPIGYLQPGSTGGLPEFNLMAAGNLVFIVPVVLVFFVGQRYFVQGIVTSGLKG